MIYVSQGYKNDEKPFIVIYTATLPASSIRLIISGESVLEFRIFLHDGTQAYLQSKNKLTRNLYIRPKKQDPVTMGLQAGDLINLINPLYGLFYNWDDWGDTSEINFFNDVSMTPMVCDRSMYLKTVSVRTIGITGQFVDNVLHLGSP